MKKYYKSLDYLLLALASSKAGKHTEAASFFVKAAEAEDVEEMVEDVNATNEELVDAEEAPVEDMAKVMAKAAKIRQLRKQLAEAEDEEDDDEEEVEPAEEEAGDDEAEEKVETEEETDEVTARLQRRQARAQANLKKIK